MKVLNDSDFGGISPAKIAALRVKMDFLNIKWSDIDEKFCRGSGKGGQKINKTSNAVFMHYAPLDIYVKCQRERSRALNRFIALRELVEKIEMKISPGTSERLAEIEKIRKRKKDKERKRSLENSKNGS